MFASRVSSSLLFDRLNAEANSPEMLSSEQVVKSSMLPVRSLGELVNEPINNSIRNITEQYGAEGADVPLFRPADMRGLFLDTARALRVTRVFEQNHKKARVHPGNIVISAAGTVASVARVPSNIEFGCINGSFARVVLPKESEGFVLCFLASRYGFQAMMRWAVGSVQKHLNLEDLPNVKVALPCVAVQKYFGDKVRHAERSRIIGSEERTFAVSLLESLLSKSIPQEKVLDTLLKNGSSLSADNLFHCETNNDCNPETLRQSRVPYSEMTDRLDAGYYRPDFLENAKDLASCGLSLERIEDLCEKCNCGATPVDVEYGKDGQGLVRTSDVRPNRFQGKTVLRTNRLNVESDSPVAAIAGDVLYTMSGTIGFAAVIPETTEIFSFSNTIARARIAPPNNPWFVSAFFNSSMGYKQSLRLTSGGIQGHVMPNPFKRLWVPVPDPRIQDFIGGKLQVADMVSRLSERLVTSAKLLVEALIERSVTEDEIIRAQVRLENGDDSADRAILSRLFEGGWDATETRPLFPDLDAYYETLRMVEREKTEVAAK